MAYMYGGKQEQAATELSRAEALASSDADVLICVAWSLPPLGQSKRAVALAERSLQLNPHYPDWYNQGLSYVYFFGGQYDKAAEYRLLVKKPLALDHAFAAVTYAYLDRPRDAEAAAASVLKLDPVWNAERYLSEGGGFADREAELFVDGARKAGLPSCMPSALLKDVPHFIRVKSCDRQRASTSG